MRPCVSHLIYKNTQQVEIEGESQKLKTFSVTLPPITIQMIHAQNAIARGFQIVARDIGLCDYGKNHNHDYLGQLLISRLLNTIIR